MDFTRACVQQTASPQPGWGDDANDRVIPHFPGQRKAPSTETITGGRRG